MTPEYFYKAVPVLTPHVYRQANLTNKSKYVLLPGEATMYNGTDFVGRMNLPLVAIGETVHGRLRHRAAVAGQRQMIDKTRTMQGGNQILKYEYRILVSSYKPEKVKLQIWDRLPQAENETMGVTPRQGDAGSEQGRAVYLREERPHNLLRWDVDIEPEDERREGHDGPVRVQAGTRQADDDWQLPEQVRNPALVPRRSLGTHCYRGSASRT